MSLHPTAIKPVPEQTSRIAKAAFPKGNLYMTMRDEFATFFSDEEFADLFPRRGQPAEVPWRLALVTIMQFVENLSDRQTADAVRAGIDWKWQRRCALCPGGKTSAVFRPTRNARGSSFLLAVFAKADCQACSHRAQCTRSQSGGRTLYLHPQSEH